MRKDVALVSTMTLVVVMAMVSSVIAQDHVGAASGPPRIVLHLTQTFDDFFNLDLGDPGVSLGDEFGVTASWFKDGEKVATVGGTCTKVILQPQQQDLCVLSARFGDGLLTAQTLFDESSSAPVEWAITGGTGAYRNAGGFLTIGSEGVTVHINRLAP
jgi:hypothetical protein